jgi:hypothetical protein
MADAVGAFDHAITHRKKGRAFERRPFLKFLASDGRYSPLNFLCHQPLRWGADPAADSASPACSPGPTTTRSMRGSLDPIS